ncbi:MAG: phosphate regulon sensor histidine kinase PhoR [Pseudomonadota bacterium]|jgi:two-component system phosphate regulon sensor histidine kinase PhoR
MRWILERLATVATIVTLGGLAGGQLGFAVGWPVLGTLLGALLASFVAAGLERRRGSRLLAWVRDASDEPAPRDGGYWAELAYRVEKALRTRERTARAEREQYRQFLQAIEASPNGVLLLDAADQIEWCNSVAADHFGLDPQRDHRQRLTNLVRAPAFVHHLQEGVFHETVVFPAPGSRGTLSVLVRPYGDRRKLVLSQDITERERTEAMRRDFVANVSHEIRTPLTVLAGFVDTLATLPLEEAERRRVLELMAQQAQRMQALVSDLLTLAQLEGGPRPPSDRWVGVPAVLAQARTDARALSEGRHALEVQPGPDEAGAAWEIAGTATELHSALGNLVSNAVRYTPAGGRVALTWRVRSDGCGEFEVSDNGPGIAREHLARLTERFYRVDGSRSRESGGTGLGLSIVKHVMQRHGGEIDIASEPGQGSRFRLVFPAARVRAAHTAAVASAAARVEREEAARLSA